MKKLLTIFATLCLLSTSVYSETQGKCQKQATSWKDILHTKVLDDLGVVQGYYEDTSITLATEIKDMDYRVETYKYIVDAENDEGDTWAYTYTVVVDVWLNAGGSAAYCDVMKASYDGVETTHWE